MLSKPRDYQVLSSSDLSGRSRLNMTDPDVSEVDGEETDSKPRSSDSSILILPEVGLRPRSNGGCSIAASLVCLVVRNIGIIDKHSASEPVTKKINAESSDTEIGYEARIALMPWSLMLPFTCASSTVSSLPSPIPRLRHESLRPTSITIVRGELVVDWNSRKRTILSRVVEEADQSNHDLDWRIYGLRADASDLFDGVRISIDAMKLPNAWFEAVLGTKRSRETS